MRAIRTLAVTLSFLAFGAVTAAIAGTHPQNHDGWTIGFGFGGGSAGISDDSGKSSDREGGSLGNFRVGFPLNEKVSLQLESSIWTKTEDGATVTFGVTTAGVAFFPSKGWVMRGGLGYGSTTVSTDFYTNFYGDTFTDSETGLGLHGAVGYEFRLARTFALGPQVDAGYASFDGGSSNWMGLGLQFNWYFVPKN